MCIVCLRDVDENFPALARYFTAVNEQWNALMAVRRHE
jgi:hypothetical protein